MTENSEKVWAENVCQLEKIISRLRNALQEYSDENNWDDDGWHIEFIPAIEADQKPWLLAEKALKDD